MIRGSFWHFHQRMHPLEDLQWPQNESQPFIIGNNHVELYCTLSFILIHYYYLSSLGNHPPPSHYDPLSSTAACIHLLIINAIITLSLFLLSPKVTVRLTLSHYCWMKNSIKLIFKEIACFSRMVPYCLLRKETNNSGEERSIRYGLFLLPPFPTIPKFSTFQSSWRKAGYNIPLF